MRIPNLKLLIALVLSLTLIIGCNSSNGGSSQGFIGNNADCTIGGTSGTPPDGNQFQEYTFNITGVASGVINQETSETGPRPDNFLVFSELDMPPGLRLDPAGAIDSSGVDVIGSPWFSGVQEIRVTASDFDNPSCFTIFEFTVFVEECDLTLSPEGEIGNPLPTALGDGMLGTFFTTTIGRSVTFGSTDVITVFFLTEFEDETGTAFDPFVDFPVPGLAVTIDTTGGSAVLGDLIVSGVPTLIGDYTFVVRVTASAAESDPTADPGACISEELYSISIGAATGP